MEKNRPRLNDIKEAYERIKPYIRRTPLLRQPNMDSLVGCEVYIKPEMLQLTGAFKLRGAMSKFTSLSKEEQQRGLITSSSGNHGQACAFIGQMFHVPACVVLPEDTPKLKIENSRAMGAKVIPWERSVESRWKKVEEEVAENGYTIVHAFEDPYVMAGQGTIALEVLEDLPDADIIMCPVGGGGLISGISTYVKESGSKARVIGVQAKNSAAYYESFKKGEKVSVDMLPTVADGITCKHPYENPWPIIQEYVDDIVTADEESILKATRLIADKANLIAEPTSAVVLGALISGQVDVKPTDKVVMVLTSGNWDCEELGLIYTGQEVPVIDY